MKRVREEKLEGTYVVANVNHRSVVALHSLAAVGLDFADSWDGREVIDDHFEGPDVGSLPVPASDWDAECLPLWFC